MDNRADRFRALMVFVGTIALVVCAAFLVGMLTMGRPVDVCPMPEDALGTFVRVEGGGFIKGADGVYPEEGQPKKLYVSPFLIQVHEVTNDQFSAFVAATGYITEAEEGGGSAQFVPTTTPENLSSWWRLDGGVTWRTPNGEGSNLDGQGRHPLVHVTLRDARSYAKWAGGRPAAFSSP